eukprot:88313_1
MEIYYQFGVALGTDWTSLASYVSMGIGKAIGGKGIFKSKDGEKWWGKKGLRKGGEIGVKKAGSSPFKADSKTDKSGCFFEEKILMSLAGISAKEQIRINRCCDGYNKEDYKSRNAGYKACEPSQLNGNPFTDPDFIGNKWSDWNNWFGIQESTMYSSMATLAQCINFKNVKRSEINDLTDKFWYIYKNYTTPIYPSIVNITCAPAWYFIQLIRYLGTKIIEGQCLPLLYKIDQELNIPMPYFIDLDWGLVIEYDGYKVWDSQWLLEMWQAYRNKDTYFTELVSKFPILSKLKLPSIPRLVEINFNLQVGPVVDFGFTDPSNYSINGDTPTEAYATISVGVEAAASIGLGIKDLYYIHGSLSVEAFLFSATVNLDILAKFTPFGINAVVDVDLAALTFSASLEFQYCYVCGWHWQFWKGPKTCCKTPLDLHRSWTLAKKTYQIVNTTIGGPLADKLLNGIADFFGSFSYCHFDDNTTRRRLLDGSGVLNIRFYVGFDGLITQKNQLFHKYPKMIEIDSLMEDIFNMDNTALYVTTKTMNPFVQLDTSEVEATGISVSDYAYWYYTEFDIKATQPDLMDLIHEKIFNKDSLCCEVFDNTINVLQSTVNPNLKVDDIKLGFIDIGSNEMIQYSFNTEIGITAGYWYDDDCFDGSAYLLDGEFGFHKIYTNPDILYQWDTTKTCIHYNRKSNGEIFDTFSRTFIIEADYFITMFALKIWASPSATQKSKYYISVNGDVVWQSNLAGINSTECVADTANVNVHSTWQKYDGFMYDADVAPLICVIDVTLRLGSDSLGTYKVSISAENIDSNIFGFSHLLVRRYNYGGICGGDIYPVFTFNTESNDNYTYYSSGKLLTMYSNYLMFSVSDL